MPGGRAKTCLIGAYSIGIAAKSGRRQNIAASPIRFDTRTNSIDVSADLITRHDRDRRQVGISTQAAHNVGEINPACLDTNPDFAGFGLWVGRFFHLENFRRANLRDPNLPHNSDLGVRAWSRNLYKVPKWRRDGLATIYHKPTSKRSDLISQGESHAQDKGIHPRCSRGRPRSVVKRYTRRRHAVHLRSGSTSL